MTYNPTTKESTYKWRDSHRENYNEYMSSYNMNRYRANKEKINERRVELYQLRKNPYFAESEIFRKILL